MASRYSVRTVFVDFAKAFDCVDHNLLVFKMVPLGLPDVIVRWICAFLRERRQHVRISDVLSDWLQLSARMPQGSYLGPLTFIILVDALQPGCLTHKYVNDTTTEVLGRSAVSRMQSFVDVLVQQATDAGMIVNGRKMKEMMIGPILISQGPTVGTPVDRITVFKLLGVHVASNLKWSQHVDAITSKAATRLHFLKQLKRSLHMGRPAVFLRHRDPGVRLPSVALKSDCHADEGTGVAAAQCFESSMTTATIPYC